MNLILDTDSYKASHHLQYPPGTEAMYSYLESRGGVYPGTIFFGLQYLMNCTLRQPRFARVSNEGPRIRAVHSRPK